MNEIQNLLGEIGKRSFWWYLCYGFGARSYCLNSPADNWLSSELHAPFAHWLDHHVREWLDWRARGIRRPKKIFVEAFRGFGKSIIGTALDQWIQLQDPEIAEVVSSYDIEKTKEFLSTSKVVWEGRSPYALFTDLYGHWDPRIDQRTWKGDALVHAKRLNPSLRDYSIKATSVGKGFTGGRPDYFRFDDPIVKEKLKEEKNWVRIAITHFDAMKYALKSNGLTIVWLTPYLEGDVADKVLKGEGVASWAGEPAPRPDFYKKNGLWHVWWQPVRKANGKSVLPQVYPDTYLAKMEEEDPEDFSSQMLCDPASGLHMPLTAADTDPLWIEPSHIPNSIVTSVHLDTAFKEPGKRGKGDFSVIEIWGHDRNTGIVYYLDGWRSNTANAMEFNERLIMFLQDLRKRGKWPFIVTDERGVGGKATLYEHSLTIACREHGLATPNFLPLTRSSEKEDRILNAVYAWKAGKVRLSRGAACVAQLVYEMTHIGFAKRDMADAGADVFDPQVYLPAPMTGALESVRGRPYDELMWAQPGKMNAADLRVIYDEDEQPKMPRHEDYAIH